MTARRDDDVLQPVHSVTSRLRWILLAHALVVNQQRLDEVAHPAALVLVCVMMLGWTAVAGRLQSRQCTRTTRLLLADLLVTMALVASSRWILGRATLVESYVSVPVYWMAASPLVIAVWRGGRWGLGSAALISLLKFVQEPRPDSRVWDSMLLVGLCAWGLGAIVDTLRESLDERDREQTRVAALAERDRLNRISTTEHCRCSPWWSARGPSWVRGVCTWPSWRAARRRCCATSCRTVTWRCPRAPGRAGRPARTGWMSPGCCRGMPAPGHRRGGQCRPGDLCGAGPRTGGRGGRGAGECWQARR